MNLLVILPVFDSSLPLVPSEILVVLFLYFKDRVKSIELCTNRFDDDTKSSFVDLYQKISDDGVSTEEVTGVDLDKADGEEIPF